MKRYLEELQQREPHERRAHALRAALLCVAAIFFVWITTLGMRLASPAPLAEGDGSSDQLANVVSGVYAPQNMLEVAEESEY